VGHGQGSFNWTVVEILRKEGFWPDIISTDMHNGCRDGPAYDLVTAVTKLLVAGMPLFEAIRAVTITPAKAIGWGDRVGSLGVGREADITVLQLAQVDVQLEDCQSQLRACKERLLPVRVWRAGEEVEVSVPPVWPNPDSVARNRPAWDALRVRDAVAPAEAPAHLMVSHYVSTKKKHKSGDFNPVELLPLPVVPNSTDEYSDAVHMDFLGFAEQCTPCDSSAEQFATLRAKALRWKCC